VILFDTLMGKGVPFLEQREKNHFIRVDPPEWQQALPSSTSLINKEAAHEHRRRKKPRLTTSAMIASIAAEGPARAGRPSARRWWTGRRPARRSWA
jgi:hypothetical protein